jgi:hypothetical protein
MDPYLESQGNWQDFHTSILVECRKELKGVLPKHYAALIEERITLVDLSAEELRISQPDVAIAREDRGPIAAGSRGVFSTLQPVTIPLIIEAVDKIRLRWIEIRRVRSSRFACDSDPSVEFRSRRQLESGRGFFSNL